MKLSKYGLVFASIFGAVAAYCFIEARMGAWEAPFLIIILTFPFSVGISVFVDHLQTVLHLSWSARSALQIALTTAFGLVEFYLVGVAVARWLRVPNPKLTRDPP